MKTTIFFLLLTSFVFGQDFSFDTTLVNNGLIFHLKTKPISSDLLLLSSISNNQTTVIDSIQSAGLAYIEYPDFNKDGNADILMDYFGNNSMYFLYLFDPATNEFREIKDYANFPDAIQIEKNLNYYYSYHRAGCADMDWASDLFAIQNFKIIQLGHIDGQGCDFDVKETPQVISIYRVSNNDEYDRTLVEELPYLKFIPEFGDKWTFIQEYWNENYTKFE